MPAEKRRVTVGLMVRTSDKGDSPKHDTTANRWRFEFMPMQAPPRTPPALDGTQ